MIIDFFKKDYTEGIDPELLKQNELEVNRQHRKFLYCLIALGVFSGILSWRIDGEKYFFVNMVAIGSYFCLLVLESLFDKLFAIESSVYKYWLVGIGYLPIMFLTVLSVDNCWIIFGIPILMSCRYYNVRFVLLNSLCVQVALIPASLLVAYAQPLLGYANSGAVFLPAGTAIPESSGNWLNELTARMITTGQIDQFQYWLDLYFSHVIWFAVAFLGISVICIMTTIQEMKNLKRQTAALDRQRQLDKELEENRQRIMISQIQPHFIFNVLNSVYELCECDAEKAQEMVLDFSSFLRHDIDTLSCKESIPFSKEMDFVYHYLKLEQMRFQDRLKVSLDLETESFWILPMTIQPLVENAVKHGICRKKQGGTVQIRTRELQNEIQIQIEDDGVGFSVEEVFPGEGNHIGLKNVKYRLEKQMNGRINIDSVPGQGTMITILLPKEI